MKTHLKWSALVVFAISLNTAAAEKPRVFITESESLQLSGNASLGEAKGSLLVTGGTSPQNVEVMKQFQQRCPGVIVTANREKAEYIVRLDHEEASPMTPFVRANKVAVFNRDLDLIYSGSTRFLSNAVKGACAAITGVSPK